MKVILAIVSIVLMAHPVFAGCTWQDVCADVLSSLVIVRNQGTGTSNISWSSDSEPGNTEYRVVRSTNPGGAVWTEVDWAYAEESCGETPADYAVEEDDPGEQWIYGVQIWHDDVFRCTVVEQ